MDPSEPFLLFDDARDPRRGRLYRRPLGWVEARTLAEVGPAMERLRAALGEGHHLAGFLAYEAGAAFDPALAWRAPEPGPGDAPLLWFALFGPPEAPDILLDALPPAEGAFAGAPRPRIARGDYLAAAGRVHEALLAGDYYQANLTFGCEVAVAGSPLALYRRLRPQADAGWGGIVRTRDRWLLSFSPEQFFALDDGWIEARPMKGTARRGATPAQDREQARALAADPKQRAENLMIVDLLRNDLARIAAPGSVSVPELFAVETYPTVHQMVSRVRARLRDGLDGLDALAALFPCGSITGAPKIAAVRALRTLEAEPRGPYTGAMGWIEPGRGSKPGAAAFNVMIRTLEWRDNAGCARLGLGSGLVVDSKAADEWDECRLKGEFVSRRQPRFDLIETMQFDPSEGLIELERHLERMRGSADALGLRYDRHAARNELQAATFGHRRRAMVRLLLSPSGRMSIEVRPLDEPETYPVRVAVKPLPVDPSDFRLRHKTTDRHFFDDLRSSYDGFELAFERPDGLLTEGSRSSLFVERDGVLVTPALALGLMPSVFRQMLLDTGRAVEGELRRSDLEGGFFIGNSARGLIPARLEGEMPAAANDAGEAPLDD